MATASGWEALDWDGLVDHLLQVTGTWLVTVTDPRDQPFLVFHASDGSFRRTGEGLEIELHGEPLVAGGRFMLLAHDFRTAHERSESSAAGDDGKHVYRVEMDCFTVGLEPQSTRA